MILSSICRRQCLALLGRLLYRRLRKRGPQSASIGALLELLVRNVLVPILRV